MLGLLATGNQTNAHAAFLILQQNFAYGLGMPSKDWLVLLLRWIVVYEYAFCT